MTRIIRLDGNYSLSQLETHLRALEAGSGEVKHLAHNGQDTVARVDNSDDVLALISLVLDPSGTYKPPPGHVLVERGEVYVEGTKQKVVAFRESD